MYENTDIWHPYGDQLAQDTRIVPSHWNIMSLGSGRIKPESIRIIFTPTQGGAKNVSSHSEIVVSVASRSRLIPFEPIFSLVSFYKTRGKELNQLAAGSSYDSIQNILIPR